MKLLTVTIPCYNSENYMEKCVDSLLAGGEDVELLIVDRWFFGQDSGNCR